MNRVRGEIVIDAIAFQQMIGAKPSDEERDVIRNILHDLGDEPLLGYKVPFLHPPLYRIDAGRFRLHYHFDDREVRIGFIGVY